MLADAWLPDLVRLGVLEAHLGDGVIEKIVEKGLRNGRLPLRERRRLLSYPMVIRLVIAMTLLPASSYAEAMRTVAGLLADVPFTLGWHVPAGKSLAGTRENRDYFGTTGTGDGSSPFPSSVVAVLWAVGGTAGRGRLRIACSNRR